MNSSCCYWYQENIHPGRQRALPSLTLWQSDCHSTLSCIILSLIYFVPRKPELSYSSRQFYLPILTKPWSWRSRFLFRFIIYKNPFLRKKIKLTTCDTWFGQSGKERSNPRQYGTKKLLTSFCQELLFRPSEWIRGPNWRHENLRQQKGLVIRFLNCQ